MCPWPRLFCMRSFDSLGCYELPAPCGGARKLGSLSLVQTYFAPTGQNPLAQFRLGSFSTDEKAAPAALAPGGGRSPEGGLKPPGARQAVRAAAACTCSSSSRSQCLRYRAHDGLATAGCAARPDSTAADLDGALQHVDTAGVAFGPAARLAWQRVHSQASWCARSRGRCMPWASCTSSLQATGRASVPRLITSACARSQTAPAWTAGASTRLLRCGPPPGHEPLLY